MKLILQPQTHLLKKDFFPLMRWYVWSGARSLKFRLRKAENDLDNDNRSYELRSKVFELMANLDRADMIETDDTTPRTDPKP